MALTLTPMQQAFANSSAPQKTPALPQGAFTAQAGAQQANLGPLMQALMQQKMQQKLNGQLPGTTPQTLGAGTGGSDAATGPNPTIPLSLGGLPQMNA